MKIALLGFGTVGKSVYEIIKDRFSNELEIVKILVRNKREEVKITTTNFEEIITDKSIDTVVEVIGGMHPAYEFIKQSLASGKNVVSANKAVISENLQEFTQLARENNVSFKYEASVCGGIPFLESLKKIKRIDNIEYVAGIFNGTTNFILDKMSKQKINFADVLKEAQQLGYAETDPTNDIKGFDTQRKLSIASSLAFDGIIKNENVFVSGIENIDLFDIEIFNLMGLTVKLYATSVRKGGEYIAVVEPVLFGADDIETNIGSNFNIACINGSTIGDLKLYGQGAGGLPTANAVIQDILDIKDNVDFGPVNFDKKYSVNVNLLKSKYYIRTDDRIDNEIIEETKTVGDKTYHITKPITCDIVNSLYKNNEKVFYARIK